MSRWTRNRKAAATTPTKATASRGGHGRMSQWTRNRKAAATTLTKATASRGRSRPDEPMDAEPQSGCHDPD